MSGGNYVYPPVVWRRQWRRPRVTLYTAAPPRRWRVARNRYGTCTIGVAVQAGSRVLSLVWARPVESRP
ncbi:MAG: hypothetical protein ACRD0P_39035 [Stackebrandtia sp.]